MNRTCTAIIAEDREKHLTTMCNEPTEERPIQVAGSIYALVFLCEKHMAVHEANELYWKQRLERSNKELKGAMGIEWFVLLTIVVVMSIYVAVLYVKFFR